MDATLYSRFKDCAERGDRRQAARYVQDFVESFGTEGERYAWTREFLEKGDFGHKIRHELYRDLIFPLLYTGFKKDDPWSLYFLAETIQNVYDVKEFNEMLEMATDYSLLLRCFRIAPNFRDVRRQLLDRVCRGMDFAVHEWPVGLCCEIEDLECELRLARELDKENRRSEVLGEIESILSQAKANGANTVNPAS